jgi:F0F1-type ATP synthase assembly protein I
MFALAVIFALVDVAYWAEGWKPWPAGLLLIVPYAVALSAVEYLGIAGVVRAKPSVPAYIRFACTSLLVVLPAMLGLAVLFAAPVIGRSTALLAFGVGVVVGIAVIAFLPAWPVAQSFSSSLVTPVKVFKATRGFRWGLVGAAILLSVFNRQDLIPAVDKATDLSHAFAYAAGEAGISTLSMMYTAAVAATAFIFACRNDDDLYPPRDGSNLAHSSGQALSSEDAANQSRGSDASMYLKATAFWIVVLVGLTLLFFFVPAANTIPQSAIVAFLLVIGAGYVFLMRRKRPIA